MCVFPHVVPFTRIFETPAYTVHIRAVCTRSISDVGDVKGEIAFLGPLLHFKGFAQGLCDVCFKRIASCLPEIQENLSVLEEIFFFSTLCNLCTEKQNCAEGPYCYLMWVIW